MASIMTDQGRVGTRLHKPPFTPVEIELPHEPPAAQRQGGSNGPTRTGGAGFLCREHVLAATAACFDEFGYEGTTIRAIAGRLGCAVGSIYRYCRDKRELLAACAAMMLEPVVDELGAEDRTFAQSVRRYVHAVEQRHELYRLMFWIGDGAGGLPLVVKRVIGGWARLLGDVAEARRRWALLHGLLMLGGDPRKVIDTVCADVHPPSPPQAPPRHVGRDPQTSAAASPDHRPAPAGREDITLL